MCNYTVSFLWYGNAEKVKIIEIEKKTYRSLAFSQTFRDSLKF